METIRPSEEPENLEQINIKNELPETLEQELVFSFSENKEAGEELTEETQRAENDIKSEEGKLFTSVKDSFQSVFTGTRLAGAAAVVWASTITACGDNNPNVKVASAPSIEKKIGREITGVEKARLATEQAKKSADEEIGIIIAGIERELIEAKRDLTLAKLKGERIERIDKANEKVEKLKRKLWLEENDRTEAEEEKDAKMREVAEKKHRELLGKRSEEEREAIEEKEKKEKIRELEGVNRLMPLVLKKEEAYMKLQGFKKVERKGDDLHVTFAKVPYLVPPDNIPNFLGALKILENERDDFPREKRGEIRWGTRLEGIIKNHGTELTPARSESEFQPKKGGVKSEIRPEEKSNSEKLLDEKLKTAEENAIYSMRQYGFEVLKNTSDQLFSIQIDSESYQIHKKNVPKLAEFITGLEYERKHLYQAWENYKLREVHQLKMRGRFTGAQQKRINGEIRHIERITRADLAGRVKQYVIEIAEE